MKSTLQFPKNKVATTFFPLILLADCFYGFINTHLSIPGVRFVPDLFLIALFFFSLKEGYGFRHKKEFTFLRRTNFFLLLVCLFHLILFYIEGTYFHSIHPSTLLNPIWEIWPYLQLPIYGYISFRILEEGGYSRLLKTIILISLYLTFMIYYPSFLPMHDAFIAGLDIIIVLFVLYNILHYRYNSLKLLILTILMLLVFFLPFYSFLRGASITSVIVVILLLISNRDRLKRLVILFVTLAIIITIVSITIWKPVTIMYSKHSRFNYSNPFMLFQSVSGDAPNVKGRIDFWSNAIDVLETSPILGSKLDFSFQFGVSGDIVESSWMHNYFISAFIDCGLILLIPLIMLLIYTLYYCIYGVIRKSVYAELHACIALVIISTYASNCFGHQPQFSRVGGIILMSSLVMLSSVKYRMENSNE